MKWININIIIGFLNIIRVLSNLNGYYPALTSNTCCNHNAPWDDPFTLMCTSCSYDLFSLGKKVDYKYYSNNNALYEISCTANSVNSVICSGKNNQNGGTPYYTASCNITCINIEKNKNIITNITNIINITNITNVTNITNHNDTKINDVSNIPLKEIKTVYKTVYINTCICNETNMSENPCKIIQTYPFWVVITFYAMGAIVFTVICRVFWFCCLKNIFKEALDDFVDDYIFCGYKEQLDNMCCCCGFICNICKECQENEFDPPPVGKDHPTLEQEDSNIKLTINPIHTEKTVTTPNGSEIRRRVVEL